LSLIKQHIHNTMTETTSIEELERLVLTSQKELILDWVFNNLDYSIYEHLCFITGDAG